jgi:NAD(P)-dependent dehydrogenase (short-subunit alcohol dehydrogenase family)
MKRVMKVAKEKIALVTGAGNPRGIGTEVARQLAVKGYRVVLTARDRAAAIAQAGKLSSLGLSVTGMQLDVTDIESIQQLASDIGQEFGHLDILINNAAGVAPYGELAQSSDLAKAHAVIETTLFGAWSMMQVFLPLLRKSEHPRIVNVSSGAGSHGDTAFGLTTTNSMGTSYAVAKAALNALSVKFANEERVNGVLVNAVCPGFTATFEGGEQMGARPVEEGAASVVWAALLPDDGPTGGFFRDGKPLPW